MLRLRRHTRGTSSDDILRHISALLRRRRKTKKKRIIMTKQRAFVFIKPHACVPKNDNNLLYKQKLVETFTENGCEVIKEGKISSSVIEKRKLDRRALLRDRVESDFTETVRVERSRRCVPENVWNLVERSFGEERMF